MSEAEPGRSWTPVDAPRRAVALDAARGLAILGVLLANTLTFAYPLASSPHDLAQWRGTGAADRVTLLAVALLVEGRFYTLLSVLFGFGVVLQAERARAAGRRFAPFYLRRAGLLFLIGVLHSVLLYSADILAFYAVVSVAALALVNLRARPLFGATIVSALLGVGVLSIYAWTHQSRPYPAPLDWSGPAPQVEARLDFIEHGAARVLGDLGMPRQGFFDLMADEARTFRSGGWREQTRFRAIASLLLAFPSKVLLLGFTVLSFFTFGMAVARSVLATSREAGATALQPDAGMARRCRSLWRIATPLGLTLMAVASIIPALMPRWWLTPPAYWVGTFGGVFLQSLGYAGGIVALASRRPDQRVVRGLAVVGRTALSNYLLQSVVLGFVFYGGGLGLFTAVTASLVVSLAVPILVLEVGISGAWLRRFTMGPVEWVWRSLAYGERLPLRRRA
jgi:uncharacterized protein